MISGSPAPPPLLISNTLKHVPCVRRLRLIDGADSWSEAGRPPVSGRLPWDSAPLFEDNGSLLASMIMPPPGQQAPAARSLAPHGCRWQLVLMLLIFSGGIIRHRFLVRTQMPCTYSMNKGLICFFGQAWQGSFFCSLMFQSIMKNEWLLGLFPAAMLLCTLAQEIYSFLRRLGRITSWNRWGKKSNR